MYPNYGDELRVSSQRSGKKVSENGNTMHGPVEHSKHCGRQCTIEDLEKKEREALLQNSDVETHEDSCNPLMSGMIRPEKIDMEVRKRPIACSYLSYVLMHSKSSGQ